VIAGVEVEMASLPDSRLNDEEKRKEEDAESFSRAMQLATSVVLRGTNTSIFIILIIINNINNINIILII